MAYYLSKYKGVYRLKVDYDEETGDFYKESDDTRIDTDVYIECKRGRIFHFGGNVLTAYVEPCDNSYITKKYIEYYNGDYDLNQKIHKRPPSDYTFNPLEETKDKRLYLSDGVTEYLYKKVSVLKSYSQMFKKIVKEYNELILDNTIMESDIGGSFRFKAKDIEVIANAMGVYTSGAKSSPFSTKYLPKDTYNISDIDLERMKVATSKFDKTQMHYITKAYREFAKLKGLDYSNMKKEYRLSPKEVFHKLGYFDELIKYLDSIKV